MHGQRVELFLVPLAVGEAPGAGELGEQPVRLGDRLLRRVDEAFLSGRPAGRVLVPRRGLQRPRPQRAVPLHPLGEFTLGGLGVAVVPGDGPVVLGPEAPPQVLPRCGRGPQGQYAAATTTTATITIKAMIRPVDMGAFPGSRPDGHGSTTGSRNGPPSNEPDRTRRPAEIRLRSGGRASDNDRHDVDRRAPSPSAPPPPPRSGARTTRRSATAGTCCTRGTATDPGGAGAGDRGDPSGAEFQAPGGVLLVARYGGEPGGMAGVRLLDAATAELKRVFVCERLRGRGGAALLLAAPPRMRPAPRRRPG